MGWDLITEILISNPADVKLEEGSHKVLLVEPQPDDRTAGRTTIISGTVSQLLWERDSDQHWQNHRKLFKTLLRVPDAKGFCGNFFEPAFHALCIRGTMLKIYPMTLKRGRSLYTLTVPESGSNFLELELGQRRRFSFDKGKNKITSLDSEHYYQPTSKNYLSLDSFVYDPDSHQINLFQVTVAKSHDLVSKGVQDVRELGQRLEIDLRIRIIVVLFGDVDIDFKAQMGLYDNWGLQTYVVQMTEDQLYPRP